MESLDDNLFGSSNLSELRTKFEKMVKEGGSLYYEVDDLEELLEHYMVHHRLDMAFKVVETAHSQYPQNRQLSIKEAELLSLSDKHTEALDLLSEIENLEGFNPDFHITKASVLSQCGEYRKAIESLNEAMRCSTDDKDMIYMSLAIEYQNLEQYTEAIDYLKKALELNYDNEDALYELAYCFELCKSYEEAVSTFNKVIDQTPYNSHAWFNLGASYQALGEFEKALVAFDYVVLIDESFHAAYFNKANVLVRLNRYADAIELYKKALAFEILDSLIYFYIGDCYDHLEDHRNALIHFEKAIKKDDTLAEAWIGASSSLDMLGRELESLEYARRAIKIDSENGDYWCFLAGLQMKYDLPDDSVNSFENAIEFGYTHKDLWEDYAQLCLTLKNNDLCDKVLSRGIALHGDNRLLQVYKSIHHYRNNEEDAGFELLVSVLMQEPALIEEFILYYPKGVELEEIQFLIESMK